jgi:hypothetical protein
VSSDPDSSAPASEEPWLSPSSASRLLACPASLTPPEKPIRQAGQDNLTQERSRTLPSNAGSSPRHGSNRRAATGRGPQTSSGTRPKRLACAWPTLFDGRLTQARLRRRADDVQKLIAGLRPDSAPACEVPLIDETRHLRGRADLVVGAARRLAIIDPKTGLDGAARQLPDRITTQLRFHDHLATMTYGKPPTYLAVYSLQAGLRQVDPDHAATAALIERTGRARDAWVAGHRDARPSPAICRYCPRRLECEPHWKTASSWENCDGVEGTALRLHVAQNGATPIYQETHAGDRGWLTHIHPDERNRKSL